MVSQNKVVELTTNFGSITLEVDFQRAPETAKNFMNYVEQGFYNRTIFHRVINGFMIQGGGFDEEMMQQMCNDPIPNEADNGLSNKAYTVAMARTSEPHSATAQFFINVANNNFLDHKSKDQQGWGYCVFGKVLEGKNVVDAIKAVDTHSMNGHDDVPVEPVIIEMVAVIESVNN